MVRSHVDGQAVDLTTTVGQVDGKDTNLTPFKTPFQDPRIKTGIENAKRVPFKTPFQDPYVRITRIA